MKYTLIRLHLKMRESQVGSFITFKNNIASIDFSARRIYTRVRSTRVTIQRISLFLSRYFTLLRLTLRENTSERAQWALFLSLAFDNRSLTV